MDRKVCLLTGASAGIGEAAALALAREGFALALAARRADRLESLAKSVEASGGRAVAIPADLASEEDVRRLVERTMEVYGRIDVLVNNAGYGKGAPLERLSRADARRQFEVNFFGPMQLCALVAPIMRRQGGGRILNVSSVSAVFVSPMVGVYCASKAALDMATESLRIELAPWNIDVVLVSPGTFETEAMDVALADALPMLDEKDNPYVPYLLRVKEKLRIQMKRARPPALMGRTIARAATDARPKTRYIAPWDAALIARLVPLLPTRWIAGFWRWVLTPRDEKKPA